MPNPSPQEPQEEEHPALKRYSLGQLAEMCRENVVKNQPKLLKELRSSGSRGLEGFVQDRAKAAQSSARSLLRCGFQPHEAWDQAIRENLLVAWDEQG